jgi:hypothetical protein
MPQIRPRRRLLVVMGVVSALQIGAALISQPVSAQTADGWEVEFTGGFGDANNIKIKTLAVFDGDLYAGTHNVTGCKILKRSAYPIRSSWDVIASGGWGDGSNQAATAMQVFTYTLATPITALYVGTMNQPAGAEIWQYNEGTWYPFNTNGFGNVNNYIISDLEVFGDSLFAAAGNTSTGAEIWNFSGITWYPVMTGGFGTADNTNITTLKAFNGKLYASTMNPNGGDIWESSNGVNWARTVPEGFFDGTYGNGVTALTDVCGSLYAAVFSNVYGVGIWRVAPGTPVLVNPTGFGDWQNSGVLAMTEYRGELYVGTHNSTTGSEIWRLRAGVWTQESERGFGDVANLETSALTVFDDRLIAGLWNGTDGAELWRLPVILADGFESGGTQGWSISIP